MGRGRIHAAAAFFVGVGSLDGSQCGLEGNDMSLMIRPMIYLIRLIIGG